MYWDVEELRKQTDYLHQLQHLVIYSIVLLQLTLYWCRVKKENFFNTEVLKKIEFEFQLKALTSETEEIKRKNSQLTDAFKKIELQRNEITYKNIAITDSIHYAKRIQLAILPNDSKVKSLLKQSFIF